MLTRSTLAGEPGRDRRSGETLVREDGSTCPVVDAELAAGLHRRVGRADGDPRLRRVGEQA